jgi:hypothetical protein
MGDQYGRSDINEVSIGISKWDMCCRYWIWANHMGDDSIDMVVLEIDMGCLVTLVVSRTQSSLPAVGTRAAPRCPTRPMTAAEA